MSDLFSFLGPISTPFGAWLVLAFVCAVLSRDRRARAVAALLLAVWIVTFVPQTELAASIVSFVILARLQIRQPREPKLAWWIVPVMAAEFGILLSHVTVLLLDYTAYWLVVQALFVLQLAVLTVVSGRLLVRRVSHRADKVPRDLAPFASRG